MPPYSSGLRPLRSIPPSIFLAPQAYGTGK
jgi:hypothetical protein